MNPSKKRSLLFLIVKVLVLQTFFVFTSKYGPQGYGQHFFALGVVLTLINYFLVKEIIQAKHYALMAAIFFFSGFILDTVLINLGILGIGSTFPPIWFPTLWLIFLCYYGDVFRKMLDFPIWLMAILGSLGGSLAYQRGLIHTNANLSPLFYPIIALIWAGFMPFSLLLFRKFRESKLSSQNQ